MKTTRLVKKDNNNSVRIVEIQLYDIEGVFAITRRTGLLGGTITEQPGIIIYEGKASRTMREQADLEYASMLSGYMDKGYKDITTYGIESFDELTNEHVRNILAETLTDTKGIIKPMLAKTVFPKGDPRWNKYWLCSNKIDGVRCLMFWNKAKQCIETSSRGGKDYNTVLRHIITDTYMLDFFKTFPDIILDGEIYIHGKSLNYINGLASSKVNTSKEQESLQYYVFDIVDVNATFEQRRHRMEEIWNSNYYPDSVQIVDHLYLKGYDQIMHYHDLAVAKGYEGLVLRDPDKKYGPGSRDWRMVKIKVFEDAEFKIVGATPGLRDEDMVFIMQMKDGKTFEAKPAATREERIYYIKHINEFIGRFGTVKYFGFGANGLPNLPVFKCFK